MRPPGPTEPTTDRETNLARLRRETFDVAVIGGGIIGAAVARDAAMRGLKTAVVDKSDFAAGTSSHSSKLIHGGLRYLPQGQLRLVYRALRERERLRHVTAPHLVHPLKFLFPFYRGQHPRRTAVSMGLVLYDLFARLPSSDRHQWLSRDEVRHVEPGLRPEDLAGGAAYLDAQGDDARITLENLLDAAYHGAAAANYVNVEGFARVEHRTAALLARDAESGAPLEIRARAFVNAAGPWADEIRRLDDAGCRPLGRLTKGVHLVIEPLSLPVRNSLVLTDGRGRIVFVIRYDDCVLIGTTDTDFDGRCDGVQVDPADAGYLLDTINRSLPEVRLSHHHVAACFAGLRILPNSVHRRPSSVAREELISLSRSGLLTIAGGKLTTHRETAARIVDRIMKMMGLAYGRTPTLTVPLPGARQMVADARHDQPIAEMLQLLAERYGTRAGLIARIAAERPELAQPLAPGSSVIAAEVIHAVRNEFARSLADFLNRRTGMSWRQPRIARAAASRVASLMGQELGWGVERQRRELGLFIKLLDGSRLDDGARDRASSPEWRNQNKIVIDQRG